MKILRSGRKKEEQFSQLPLCLYLKEWKNRSISVKAKKKIRRIPENPADFC